MKKQRVQTALFAMVACGLAACASFHRTAPPIVQVAVPPPPLSLAFEPISDKTVAAKLITAPRPGQTVVTLRDFRTQHVSSATFELSGVGTAPSFVTLPSPWNGELRVASKKDPVSSTFIAVLIEPLFPAERGREPRILYGPRGHASVRLGQRSSPPAGTHIVFTSPSNAEKPPAGLSGDTVEIGFIPSRTRATLAVIGLSPLGESGGSRLAVHFFDRTLRQWTVLPSHAGRDGTVYATGQVPGLYALAAVAP